MASLILEVRGSSPVPSPHRLANFSDKFSFHRRERRFKAYYCIANM